MALHLDKAPAGAARAVGELLVPPAALVSPSTRPARPEAARPIPIYAPSFDALARGGTRALDEARLTGWRFLVFQDGELLIADVPEDDGGARLLRGGRMGEKLARASLAAEKIAEPSAEYEVRILDVHPIGQPVLWLRNREPRKGDRFVSLGRAARALSGPRLLRKLRRTAPGIGVKRGQENGQ
jgi:hypothetical protein